MFERKLDLRVLLNKKSFFLLGPRATGKSTLIRQQLSDATIIDLLESDHLQRLANRPQSLEELLPADARSAIVVIDEVQKLPVLLDEVHRLIERRGIRFLLTGSSARKLKGNQANLLAGRAWMAQLFPLTWEEIPEFRLERYLLIGGLPAVYPSEEPWEELAAYVRTYLYEEIRAEALVRKIPAFSRFLEVAALSNGQLLNFTEIGRDCEVAPSTVREYYAVLEDTMVGFLLPPWRKSTQRKAIQTAKFYFFDTGVTHALADIHLLERHSDSYGQAFEQFIGMELRAYLSYSRSLDVLTFWRSVHGQEVDFLIGDRIAIEVKSTTRVAPRHIRGLAAIAEEREFSHRILVSQDRHTKSLQGVQCLHWEEFLQQLWAGKITRAQRTSIDHDSIYDEV